MKKQPNTLRLIPSIGFLLSMIFSGTTLHAKKIDWSTGLYQIAAKNKTNPKGETVSGFSNQISLRMPLLQQIEVSVGYTLMFSEFFSGDMGYGPDLGLFYYPLSYASRSFINKGNLIAEQYEPLRPFVVAQFQQRQYQSVQTSYAGFSFGLGTEYWFDPHFAFRVWANMSALKGPAEATASESNFLGGLTVEF